MIAAIALGSNLHEALRQLQTLGQVTAVSSFHDTDPVGYEDQPRFLNAAALLETELPPLELLHALLGIEHSMGRDRSTAPLKGPRIIDLDLLLFGEIILQTPELTLPHPAMNERRFVLAPLVEVAPKMQHPTLHQSIAELFVNLPLKP